LRKYITICKIPPNPPLEKGGTTTPPLWISGEQPSAILGGWVILLPLPKKEAIVIISPPFLKKGPGDSSPTFSKGGLGGGISYHTSKEIENEKKIEQRSLYFPGNVVSH
jgi:hypothetical protein